MNLCIASSGDFFSDYGGGQVYVRNIVDEFSKRADIQMFIVSRRSQNRTADYRGIEVYEYSDADSLHKILTAKRPDVVHANGDKLTVAKVCKSLDIPCVVTAHHGGIVCPAGALLNTNDEICKIPASYQSCLKCYLRNTPTGLFWYPLLRHISQKRYITLGKYLKKLPFIPFLSPIGKTGLIVSQKIDDWKELSITATSFIAPSNAIAEALIRNGCPVSKITVIPHGLPTSEIIISNLESRISQVIKFYYIGRICYIKGIHVMLEAFHRLMNEFVELHIIGDAYSNTDKRYKKELNKKYRKDKRIIWHGKVDYKKTYDLVNQYDCLIHPTICLEVFGLDIAEALQQNKYVIATRCGGAEMQVHNEKEGLLVSPNNATELFEALNDFISNPRKSSSIVMNNEEHTTDLIGLFEKAIVQNRR